MHSAGGEEGAWDEGSLPGAAKEDISKAACNEMWANTAPARALGRSPPPRGPLHPPVGHPAAPSLQAWVGQGWLSKSQILPLRYAPASFLGSHPSF